MTNNLDSNLEQRLALVHDYMYTYGGAERVFESIHNTFPNADVYTSYYLPEAMPEYYKGWKIHESFLGKLPFLKHTFLRRYFTFPNFWALWLLNLKKYDVIISSSSGPAKGVRFRKGAKHISYIHTPHWEAWGIKNTPSFFIQLFKPFLRWLEFNAAQMPTKLLANSRTTQDRIKKFYKRDSEVLYPPVEVEKITSFLASKNIVKEDFYIMVCRLDLYKGASIVAKILEKNGLKLKIIGKGEDAKNLVGFSSNIEYLGPINDEEKYLELAKAKAFIMWNVEDFGISMVESLAAGTPVIALSAGGALDIIEDGVNGVFFSDQNENSLIKGINNLSQIQFDTNAVIDSSKKFSVEEFQNKLREIVNTI